MRRPTSPGRAWDATKMTTDKSHSATAASATRRSRKRSNPCVLLGGDPCEPEVHVTHAGRLYARDLLLDRGQEVVVVRDDQRRLVEEQLLDLPGDGLLGGEVDSLDVVAVQAVIRLVVEVR